MARKPNIVILIADQLRRQAMAHHGGPMSTPSFDRLARDGVTLTDAYTAYPMCTPARAALVTGVYPHALRDVQGLPYLYNDRRLDPASPSFARVLTEHGYRCGWIGKWHLDSRDPLTQHIPRGPLRFGFDDIWAGINIGSHPTAPFYYDDDGVPVHGPNPGWEAAMQTDLMCRHLDRLAGGADPFCLVVSWLPPHDPYDMPPQMSHVRARAAGVADRRPNIPERLHDQAGKVHEKYFAAVSGIDDQVAIILDQMDRLGIADQTIVLATADHGTSLMSHGLIGKNQFFEEAIAIPSIWRLPGVISPASDKTGFCNLVDVGPTVLGLCGLPIPERMQGDDLSAFLRGQAPAVRQSAYLEVDHPWFDFRFGQGPGGNKRCLITPDWKLVLLESQLGIGGAVPWQLFCRRTDPYELRNLAEDPGYQQEICALMPEFWAWMQRTEDPFREVVFSGMRRLYGTLPEHL